MNDKYYNIDLFARIKHYGYENEYPFCDDDGYDNYSDDFYDTLGDQLGDDYRYHSECGGMEMYNPKPYTSYVDLLSGINHIYDAIYYMQTVSIATDSRRTMTQLLDRPRQSTNGYYNYWSAYNAFVDSEDTDYSLKRDEDEEFATRHNIEFTDDTDFDNNDVFVDTWNSVYNDPDNTYHYRYQSDFPYDPDDFIDDWDDIRTLDDYGYFGYEADLDDYIDDDHTIIYATNDNLLNSDDVGVHIRLDVSAWSMQEILRFVRMFSNEWNGGDGSRNDSDDYTGYNSGYYNDDRGQYTDYLNWIEDYLGRKWYNYNKPVPYKSWHNQICDRIDEDSSMVLNFRNKNYNVSLEDGDFGSGVITLEIRAFGVHRFVEHALHQAELVPLLCAVVEHSIKHGDRNLSVINQLYSSWVYLIQEDNINDYLEGDNNG